MKRITGLLYAMIFCASLIVSPPVLSINAAEYEESTSIVADHDPLSRDEGADSNTPQDTQEEQDRESKPFPMSATPNGRGDDY